MVSKLETLQKRVRSLNIAGIFFLAISLIGIFFLVGTINYSAPNSRNLWLISLLNALLVIIESFAGLFWLFFSILLIFTFYKELKYYTSDFYAGVSLWVILGLGVVYLIPGLLYLNSIMLFTHVCEVNVSELSSVFPDLTLADFINTLMDSAGSKEPSKAPSMNGHIAVGGTHEGKGYGCVDLKKMIEVAVPEGAPRTGAKVGKFVLRLPDIVCIGDLSQAQQPDKN